MVWGKQHDASPCEDVAASGLDSVRAKPLKRRCGGLARGGLSRFYSSKSQSFSCISSMLDVAQCNGSARALAKRPSSFDLCRDADLGCIGRFAPSRLERPCLATTNESSMASDDIDDDVFAERCPCNDTIFDEQDDDRERTSLSEGPLEASYSSSAALPLGMPHYFLPPHLSRSLNLSSLALPGTLCALAPPPTASSLPGDACTCATVGSIALATLSTQQQHLLNPAARGAPSGPILVPSHPHLPHPHQQQQLQQLAHHATGGTCQGTWHRATAAGACCHGCCSAGGGACEAQSGAHSLCCGGPCLSSCASGDCGGSMMSQGSSEATHWSRGSTTTSCGGSLASDGWSRQHSVLQHDHEQQHQHHQHGPAQGAAGAASSGSPCCGLWGSTEDLIAALSISEQQQERKGPTRGSRLQAVSQMQHQHAAHSHQHQLHLRRSASHAYAAHTRSARLLLHGHCQQQQGSPGLLPAAEQLPANSLGPAASATHATMPITCYQQQQRQQRQQQQQQPNGAPQPHPYLCTYSWGHSAAASAAAAAAATAAMAFGGTGCHASHFGSAPATGGLASRT